MRNILVIGAGRSSSSLIKYLLDNAVTQNWQITVADRDRELVIERTNGHERAIVIVGDALNPNFRESLILGMDIVVSMLPARLHGPIVKDCVKNKISVITPSYITDEIKEMDTAAKKAGILILNEMGLDPGIDHMSAMKIIDEIEADGGNLVSFKSFTGGLVAPESDNNPWHYKFTWNPKNVILAGQGSPVKYIKNGKYKYLPYYHLFHRLEYISIDPYGDFEGYANRDSLKYREIYGLDKIPTIYRGTLRRKGFCTSWDAFVQLGMTDDTFLVDDLDQMTYRDFINAFISYHPTWTVEMKVCRELHIEEDSDVFKNLKWLGIFEKTPIGLKEGTPAQVLEHLLIDKWKLEEEDKDMIVMWHQFIYDQGNERREIQSSMVCIGENQIYTGMAKTVGLPVGIVIKNILNGTIKLTGAHLPTKKEIYQPVLAELEEHGIQFKEVQMDKISQD